jgi:hypothetical protein
MIELSESKVQQQKGEIVSILNNETTGSLNKILKSVYLSVTGNLL